MTTKGTLLISRISCDSSIDFSIITDLKLPKFSGACSVMEMVPGYGWVTLALTANIFLNQYMGAIVRISY